MKNQKSVCVYRNSEHENLTRAQLETARQLLQNYYIEFLAMDLGEVTDINELLMQPEKVYKNAIDMLIQLPATSGKFGINKERYKENLNLPDPVKLYELAKVTKQKNYCAVPDLFEIEGKTVILNKEISTFYIEMQNVYTSDPSKIELFKDLQTFVELYNSLDKRLKNELLIPSVNAVLYFRQVGFDFKQQRTDLPFELSIQPGTLKAWLSK